jgi:hypothetical protein
MAWMTHQAMTANECLERAALCAANAAAATNDTVAVEFLTLAAKWRAMACRGISLRQEVDVIAADEADSPGRALA